MNDSARKIQFCKTATGIVLLMIASACETPKPKPTAPAVKPPPTAPATVVPPAQVLPPAPVVPPEPVATVPTPPVPVSKPPPVQETARNLSRTSWSELPGWKEDNQLESLPAFLLSCRVIAKQAVWQEACAAAPAIRTRDAARQFFESHFTPYRVANADGSLTGLATGYYEPTIRGSRQPSTRNRFPVYGAPDNIFALDLGALTPESGVTVSRVRVDGKRVVPYYTRAIIEGENSPLRGREIAWAENPIDLFFMQVQGSGRIALDEGGVMRAGFAEHNGHPYRSIGRVLIERGELTQDRASMQGIKAWASANPGKLTELLQQNPRYVFFRELPAGGGSPPGSLGVPLTPDRSIAVDPRFIPMGAPVHIATTWPNTNKPLQRLMLAQDTGGAIRGAVRIDYFWGTGERAAREAGRMQQSVQKWVLLPKGHPAINTEHYP